MGTRQAIGFSIGCVILVLLLVWLASMLRSEMEARGLPERAQFAEKATETAKRFLNDFGVKYIAVSCRSGSVWENSTDALCYYTEESSRVIRVMRCGLQECEIVSR